MQENDLAVLGAFVVIALLNGACETYQLIRTWMHSARQ